MPLQGERAPRPKEEDPTNQPYNPKAAWNHPSFPALFSQLAFFKASFWETPCRGRGSLYIARGWMVHPFLFIFPLRGLPGSFMIQIGLVCSSSPEALAQRSRCQELGQTHAFARGEGPKTQRRRPNQPTI